MRTGGRIFLALLILISALPAPLFADPHKKALYPALHGKTIRNITIKLRDIFEVEDGWIYRTANNLKIGTREEVIKRELLVKEGEPFDEFRIDESERNLRSLKYLRNIRITPTGDGDFVDLEVSVQDTWTLIPQAGFSSGAGRKKASAGIAESNLLGYGKRFEAIYSEDDKRQSVQAVWEDDRLWGTKNGLTAAYFDRTDGQIGHFSIGRPFRSLVEKSAWSVTADNGDTIGRLFKNGDEDYIFRQQKTALRSRYTIARGNPEEKVRRLSFGYDYEEDDFSQADQGDYDDLDLDPNEVSNDPARLADDRRYTGPVLTYQYVEPDYISKNYVDRFDRVEDYNLGTEYSINSFFAPKFLGSRRDSYIFSANRSRGYAFNNDSFIRGELGFASRYDQFGMDNSLYRAEVKYYNVLGPKYLGERFIGKHTLAASFAIDYGDDLDRDREFLAGGDNIVRGYKSRAFSGDKRLALNLEDRMHFVDDVYKLISVGGALFLDVGAASNRSIGDIVADEIYSDVGMGLRFAFPRSSGAQVFRVDLAFPLRDGPDGSGQFEPRLLLTGGLLFGSRLRSEAVGSEKASVDLGFDR